MAPPVIPIVAAIIGAVGAIAGGSIAAGGAAKQGRKNRESLDAANKLSYDSWEQEHAMEKEKFAEEKKRSVVNNINNMLKNNVDLQDRLRGIWGARRRGGM